MGRRRCSLAEPPSKKRPGRRPGGERFAAPAAYQKLITLERDVDNVNNSRTVTTDLIAVADHLGLDTFELFSGGPLVSVTAVMTADAFPGRVLKLVMFTPSIASSPAIVASAASIEASLLIFVPGVRDAGVSSGPAGSTALVLKAVATTPPAISRSMSRSPTMCAALAALAMPVLILHRQRAQFRDSAQVRSVASLIPGARLVMLDGDAGAP